MPTADDLAFITGAVAPLCGELHEAVEISSERATGHFIEHDLTGHGYATVRTHMTRAHLRKSLESRDLGRWRLGQLKPNCPVWLIHDLLRIRLLHRAKDAAVPAPGVNRARRVFYQNLQLDLFGARASKLLGLWSVGSDGSADIQLVRPVGTWGYGARAKVDIEFPLPRMQDDIYGLEFMPTDDDVQLDLPNEAEEGEEDADGADG